MLFPYFFLKIGYWSFMNKSEICSVFRLMKRKKLLDKDAEDLQFEIRKEYARANVEKVFVQSFGRIYGYRVSIEDEICFFPAKNAFSAQSSSARKLRDSFYEAGLIVPPFFNAHYLSQQGEKLSACEDKEFMASKVLAELYTPENVAKFFTERWSILPPFNKYIGAIKQSIGCYYAGLLYAAVMTIIPCIEGVIREIGLVKGGDEGEVGGRNLIKVVETICKDIRDRIFKEYTWFPEHVITIDFLENENEQIQMLKNFKLFFERQLYEHTDRIESDILLNRHSILHGLSFDSINESSYLRLLNMLSSLYFIAILSGFRGPSFFPAHSEQSISFLVDIQRAISNNEMRNFQN
ncbi:hypothetical protein [Halomonas sp. DP8Y7-1]|uniref:hypothetical protein n=1 Tax=Halomonas sp. DP8Y7-1 TaxID=2859078 RepID=UPI001C977E8A|nr:hypothetical protein [Halomonas sp. DP8Y7-1]